MQVQATQASAALEQAIEAKESDHVEQLERVVKAKEAAHEEEIAKEEAALAEAKAHTELLQVSIEMAEATTKQCLDEKSLLEQTLRKTYASIEENAITNATQTIARQAVLHVVSEAVCRVSSRSQLLFKQTAMQAMQETRSHQTIVRKMSDQIDQLRSKLLLGASRRPTRTEAEPMHQQTQKSSAPQPAVVEMEVEVDQRISSLSGSLHHANTELGRHRQRVSELEHKLEQKHAQIGRSLQMNEEVAHNLQQEQAEALAAASCMAESLERENQGLAVSASALKNENARLRRQLAWQQGLVAEAETEKLQVQQRAREEQKRTRAMCRQLRQELTTQQSFERPNSVSVVSGSSSIVNTSVESTTTPAQQQLQRPQRPSQSQPLARNTPLQPVSQLPLPPATLPLNIHHLNSLQHPKSDRTNYKADRLDRRLESSGKTVGVSAEAISMLDSRASTIAIDASFPYPSMRADSHDESRFCSKAKENQYSQQLHQPAQDIDPSTVRRRSTGAASSTASPAVHVAVASTASANTRALSPASERMEFLKRRAGFAEQEEQILKAKMAVRMREIHGVEEHIQIAEERREQARQRRTLGTNTS
jgi:hypothetical protein